MIFRMFIGPCIIVIVAELKTNLMSLVIDVEYIYGFVMLGGL